MDIHLKKVSLNKSGNEKQWGISGSSYSTEVKTTKATGGKISWELEVSNGDEAFTERYPSGEEVISTGENWKYTSKR